MTALQKVGFRMGRVGIEVTGSPTFEQWLDQWHSLVAIHRAVQWAIADMILYAEEKAAWGEKYAQAMDATQFDYNLNVAWEQLGEKIYSIGIKAMDNLEKTRK